MGKITMGLLAISIAVVAGVHSVWDTPIDWLLLGGALFTLAYIFPDDLLKGWWAMARWVAREARHGRNS